jgi:hypothetical protein
MSFFLDQEVDEEEDVDENLNGWASYECHAAYGHLVQGLYID